MTSTTEPTEHHVRVGDIDQVVGDAGHLSGSGFGRADIHAAVEQARVGRDDLSIQALSQSGHSRVPVYEGSLDHIIGIAHVKDLVRVQHGARRVATIRGMLREAMTLTPLQDYPVTAARVVMAR